MSEDNEERFLVRIQEKIKDKLQPLEWLATETGRHVMRSVAMIGSFALGDPTGFILPMIIETADVTIRNRFIKHVPELVNTLESNRNTLNMEFVKTDLGQKLLRDSIRNIINETEEEKIQYVKNFLLNSYQQENPDDVFIRTCFSLLSRMDSIHLQVLSTFSNPKQPLEKICHEKINNYVELTGYDYMINLWTDWNPYYFKIDSEIYKNIIDELINWNILHTGHSDADNFNPLTKNIEPKSIDQLWTSMNEIVQDHRTEFGKRFYTFLKDLE